MALLRRDIRADKRRLIAANLPLTADEAAKFWPVYDEYVAEMTKVYDEFYGVIKDYAANQKTITDAQASSMIKRWAEIQVRQAQTRQKYIPLVEKLFPVRRPRCSFADRPAAVCADGYAEWLGRFLWSCSDQRLGRVEAPASARASSANEALPYGRASDTLRSCRAILVFACAGDGTAFQGDCHLVTRDKLLHALKAKYREVERSVSLECKTHHMCPVRQLAARSKRLFGNFAGFFTGGASLEGFANRRWGA